MPLTYFKYSSFRCLKIADLEPDPRYNLIYGGNASGKTSLLEAIAYLGRGRSFRGAPTENLIRHGSNEFVLFGRTDVGARAATMGVKNSRSGLEIHIDGDRIPTAAGLAEVLPLQIVDSDVHDLGAGGPEGRRRFTDWIAFHVEHGYLDYWRRFRRAHETKKCSPEGKCGQRCPGWLGQRVY